MEKQKTIEPGIAIRISAIPVMLLFALFWSIRTLIKFLIDYVRYGGEMIVYSKQTSRTTILDCFEKLREIQEGQKKVEKTCETCKHMEYGVVKLICKTCQIRSCWEPKEDEKTCGTCKHNGGETFCEMCSYYKFWEPKETDKK